MRFKRYCQPQGLRRKSLAGVIMPLGSNTLMGGTKLSSPYSLDSAKVSLSNDIRQKQNIFFSKETSPFAASFPAKAFLSSRGSFTSSLRPEQDDVVRDRDFSTFSRLVPKRLVRVKRKFLRVRKKVSTKRKNIWLSSKKLSRATRSERKRGSILMMKRRFFKKRRFSRGRPKGAKRHYGFKRWKFRFPK